MTKPFGETRLWQGKIAKSNYPIPVAKPPMQLPLYNKLTGIFRYLESEDLNNSYSKQSKIYWAGVEERKKKYRMVNASGNY